MHKLMTGRDLSPEFLKAFGLEGQMLAGLGFKLIEDNAVLMTSLDSDGRVKQYKVYRGADVESALLLFIEAIGLKGFPVVDFYISFDYENVATAEVTIRATLLVPETFLNLENKQFTVEEIV